ncbi:unnamed protein product [Brugia timori]|uniref:Ty3-gypsy retrotransposon protein n=1 Tax=Brugia timori TaxID=42155 RepID=A0A0R3Q6P1_9BILA|nr:unnamed protein product [Brugia timori]
MKESELNEKTELEVQIDVMMATSSEAEATMNAARQIINNIEKYGHSLPIGMHSSGSLLNANNNDVVEKSVLERLASARDGNVSI